MTKHEINHKKVYLLILSIILVIVTIFFIFQLNILFKNEFNRTIKSAGFEYINNQQPTLSQQPIYKQKTTINSSSQNNNDVYKSEIETVDFCNNITDIQTSVPENMVRNSNGVCVDKQNSFFDTLFNNTTIKEGEIYAVQTEFRSGENNYGITDNFIITLKGETLENASVQFPEVTLVVLKNETPIYFHPTPDYIINIESSNTDILPNKKLYSSQSQKKIVYTENNGVRKKESFSYFQFGYVPIKKETGDFTLTISIPALNVTKVIPVEIKLIQ